MYGDNWERWKAQYRRFNAYGTFDNAFTERMGLSGEGACAPMEAPAHDAARVHDAGENHGDP
jgi:hypothetical protein